MVNLIKKQFPIFSMILIFSIIFTIACSTRIIKKTDTMAVIQGFGATKFEAIIEIESTANKTFQYYTIQEGECSQELGERGTFWQCTAVINKSTKEEMDSAKKKEFDVKKL